MRVEDRGQKVVGSMSSPGDERGVMKNDFSTENEPANPYAPTVHVDNDEGWELTGQTLDATSVRFIRVGRTIVSWEKLRLAYNLILAFVTVLTCGLLLFFSFAPFNVGRLIGTVVVGVIVANACFCLGPLIDGYLSWFGWRSALTTGVLFAIGMLISIPLAVFAVAASTIPDF